MKLAYFLYRTVHRGPVQRVQAGQHRPAHQREDDPGGEHCRQRGTQTGKK